MSQAAGLFNLLSRKPSATALLHQFLHYCTFNIKTVDRLFWEIIGFLNLYSQIIHYVT
jgi:hypothetical protein